MSYAVRPVQAAADRAFAASSGRRQNDGGSPVLDNVVEYRRTSWVAGAALPKQQTSTIVTIGDLTDSKA